MHTIKKSTFRLVLCSIMIFPVPFLAIGQPFLSRIDSLESHVLEGHSETMLYSTRYALTESKAVSNTDIAVAYVWQLIQSIALIHQNLYESEELSGIAIKACLQELSKNIQKRQRESIEQYQLELNVAHETLDIDTAIPVGLILNELLTNCYKYAFRGEEKGKIIVDF